MKGHSMKKYALACVLIALVAAFGCQQKAQEQAPAADAQAVAAPDSATLAAAIVFVPSSAPSSLLAATLTVGPGRGAGAGGAGAGAAGAGAAGAGAAGAGAAGAGAGVAGAGAAGAGDDAREPDFTDIQSAIDAASDGDGGELLPADQGLDPA